MGVVGLGKLDKYISWHFKLSSVRVYSKENPIFLCWDVLFKSSCLGKPLRGELLEEAASETVR